MSLSMKQDTDDTDRGQAVSKDTQALEGETQAGQRAVAFSRQTDSSNTHRRCMMGEKRERTFEN